MLEASIDPRAVYFAPLSSDHRLATHRRETNWVYEILSGGDSRPVEAEGPDSRAAFRLRRLPLVGHDGFQYRDAVAASSRAFSASRLSVTSSARWRAQEIST